MSNGQAKMPNHPLAEVFGFPIDNLTPEADRYRHNRLCPYNNKSPNCTKASVENPLGVCSVYGGKGDVIVTCPVRFRQDWVIATDAAEFFFPPDTKWTALPEIQLKDRSGKAAGSIDIVLLAYDAIGRIVDYGALEVQAVYISGNVSTPFEHYMEDPHGRADMDWRGRRSYPRPDYLSSSRKRLAPQLIFKGGILDAWGRKSAVALDRGFFATLPDLDEVDKADADIAWLVYDLRHDPAANRYHLERHKTVYSKFDPGWQTSTEAGDERDFLCHLYSRLDQGSVE